MCNTVGCSDFRKKLATLDNFYAHDHRTPIFYHITLEVNTGAESSDLERFKVTDGMVDSRRGIRTLGFL